MLKILKFSNQKFMNKLKRKLILRKPMYEYIIKSGKKMYPKQIIKYSEILKASKYISKLRPKSNKFIDQCPISDHDLADRVNLIINYLLSLENKDILFIGDDDLASVVIGNLLDAKLSVIDIDKNLLSLISKQTKNKSSKIINANILDIIDQKKSDPIKKSFDIFVTDPPYTEMGYKYFLSYGINHLIMHGLAFISVPYMNEEDWSSELLYKVQDFLIKNGFVIIELIPAFAEYMHEDEVLSTMIVAKKVSVIKDNNIVYKRENVYTTGFEL